MGSEAIVRPGPWSGPRFGVRETVTPRPRPASSAPPVRPATASLMFLGATQLAEDLGVSMRALRHYEELGLLEPIRTRGGMRRYSPEQRRLAAEIVRLRDFDLPLHVIRDLIDPDLPASTRNDHLLHLLEVQRKRLAAQTAHVEAGIADLIKARAASQRHGKAATGARRGRGPAAVSDAETAEP